MSVRFNDPSAERPLGSFRRAPRARPRVPTLAPLGADIGLALLLMLAGGALSYVLAGGLPLIGIDDAAITRSYADNIARGAGYVYNIGGERVEGSTAFLWVGMLSALYALTPTPELPILALCALLTALAVLAALRLTGWLTLWLDGNVTLARIVLCIALLASPGYFLWSIWTMMELALWSAAILGFVQRLSRLVEGEATARLRIAALGLALILPLIRPEGIAVGLGLGVATLCLSPRSWATALGIVVAAGASCAALTAFRLSYFGQPVPNTFYAKVSSDVLDGLRDGLRYLADFVLGAPFVDILAVLCVAMVAVAASRLRAGRPGGRALALILLTILGALGVYAALGGDHFVLWRFYQPVVPLLLVVLAVAVGAVGARFESVHPTALLVGAGACAVAVGGVQYHQARYDVQAEFALVAVGTSFGAYLDAADPQPVIGVGPAGGIALAYDGPILDLLGLNWVDMAHANPVKTGMRNHASFDADTFWRHAPDVVATFNRSCRRDTPDRGFDDLFQTARFREAYVPVRFSDGTSCWPGYATSDWISRTDLSGLNVLDWSMMPGDGG